MLFLVKRGSSRRAKALACWSAEQHPARRYRHCSMSKSPGLICNVLAWGLQWKCRQASRSRQLATGALQHPLLPLWTDFCAREPKGESVNLGGCTYTHAHTPSRWQVQREMKTGDLLFHTYWVSQLGKTSWYPCIFGITRFSSPLPVPTAVSNSRPHP